MTAPYYRRGNLVYESVRTGNKKKNSLSALHSVVNQYLDNSETSDLNHEIFDN